VRDMKGIIGQKMGMMEVFDDQGRKIPVTVVRAGPCVVVRKRTRERDGYEALQLGFEQVKPEKLNRPRRGYFKKAGTPAFRILREFRVEDTGDWQVGDEIRVTVFSPGDRVTVTGTSRGRGFAGVVKRHGFRRGPMSHGSMYHRRVGSLGASTFPGRVFKGRGMPGRMGGERVTVRNLEVVRTDEERHLLLIKGSVPGVRGSYLLIRGEGKR